NLANFDTNVWAITGDPNSGKLYAVGQHDTYPVTDSVGMVLTSVDGGVTWTEKTWDQLDSTSLIPGTATHYSDLTNNRLFGVKIDSGGNIYVAGFGYDSTSGGYDHWIIQKSANAGTTWTVVDDFYLAQGHTAQTVELGIDSNDHLYAMG